MIITEITENTVTTTHSFRNEYELKDYIHNKIGLPIDIKELLETNTFEDATNDVFIKIVKNYFL